MSGNFFFLSITSFLLFFIVQGGSQVGTFDQSICKSFVSSAIASTPA